MQNSAEKKEMRILILLFLFIGISCSNHIDNEEFERPIVIKGEMLPSEGYSESRVVMDTNFNKKFVDGDSIGVYGMVRIVAGVQQSPANNNYALLKNAKYIYREATDEWQNADGEEHYFSFSMPMDFYAYYPYQSGISPTSIAYNCDDQNYDLMWAKVLNVKPQSSGPIQFKFQSALPLFQLHLPNVQAYRNRKVMMIYAYYRGTFNLSSGYFTTSTTSSGGLVSQKNILMDETVFNDKDMVVYKRYIPPQNFAQGVPLFYLELDDDQFNYHIYSSSYLNCVGGEYYKYSPILVH